MTINQHLIEIIKNESVLFDELCVDELNSDTETIKAIINKNGISFDLAIKILDYMGFTCYFVNEETDDTIRMKPTNFPVELERLHGKEQVRYFEFENFVEEYLDFSGKSRDGVSREQVYSLYLKYCADNNLKPMSRQVLFKFLRDAIELTDPTSNKEYRTSKMRGFNGIKRKE